MDGADPSADTHTSSSVCENVKNVRLSTGKGNVTGLLAVGGISLIALVGAAALIRFVAGAGEPHTKTVARTVGLALAILAAIVTPALLTVLGPQPVLIVTLAAAILAAVTFFVLLGRDVKWAGTRIVALVGIAAMCMVLAFALGMAFGDQLPTMRAERMAREADFVVLLPQWLPAMQDVQGLTNVPPGNETITLTWVEKLPVPDAGIWLGYNGLDIYERKTGTGLSLEELTSKLPPDAVRTQITVKGQPALLEEYRDDEASWVAAGQPVQVLFFATGGVTVNMRGLSRDQLFRVAESLAEP